MIILKEGVFTNRSSYDTITSLPEDYRSNSSSILDRIRYGNWKDRLQVGLGTGLLLGGAIMAPKGSLKAIGSGLYGLGKLGAKGAATTFSALGTIGSGISNLAQ